MEVKPGYKRTEVGVIPEDWGVKALADVFTFSGGLSASRAQLGDHGYLYLHYGDIHTSSKAYVDVDVQSVDLPRLDVPLADVPMKSLLQDGDVVFVDASEDDEGASRHQVVRNPNRIPFISGLHTIVAKSKGDAIVNGYKAHCFQASSIKKQFLFYSVGTKVTGISKTNIGKILLPIPPVGEQTAISEALSDSDALIDFLRQLLAKKRQVKQGAMQELLAGQRRLPGFNEEWEAKRLGDCFALISTRNEELNDNVVTISAQQGFVRQEEFFKKRVASSVLKNYYLVERDHFAYNRGRAKGYPFGAIKRLTRYDKAVVTTLYVCFASKPEAGVDPTFFEHYFEAGLLNSGLSLVTNEGGRAHGLLNITRDDFLSLEVKRPPLPEQTAIAAVLSDMDAEIAALDARLAKARSIKQGMMQELLTGRIRLV